MSRLHDRITADIKEAMKARDKPRLTCLRMLVAAMQEEEHRHGGEDLSEDQEIAVLMRAVKTRKESVDQARELGRDEIAERESAEIGWIEAYLPRQITGDELLARVREVAAEVAYQGPKDTGVFMKAWMSRYKGQADGREVQQALKSLG